MTYEKVLYRISCPNDMIGSWMQNNLSERSENIMKNIRVVLLGELLILIVLFLFNILMGGWGLSSIWWFLDLASLVLIILVLIPGLLIMGVWKDFIKSFSVGINTYSLLELKNVIGAVDVAQKMTVFAGLFSIIVSSVLILGNIENFHVLGPNLAVCFLPVLYAVVIEFFLLPLRLNAERVMNKEMDLSDE